MGHEFFDCGVNAALWLGGGIYEKISQRNIHNNAMKPKQGRETHEDPSTDWNAIELTLVRLRREIALVQSIDKHNPVSDLADLLRKQPSILKVLQLLIAHAPDKIYVGDPAKTIDFKFDEANLCATGNAALMRAKVIARTFYDMGLLEFLTRVKSVEDVVRGVLIGLEPDARKNGRGAKPAEVHRIANET